MHKACKSKGTMGFLRRAFLFALTCVSATTYAETDSRATDVSPQITQAFPWIVAAATQSTEEEKKRREKAEAQKRAQQAEQERQRAEAQKRVQTPQPAAPKPVAAPPAPVAPPVPQIASVTPSQLTTSTQIQTITINGSGFDSGSRVELMYGVGPGAGQWRAPLNGYQVLSNSQIRVSVLTGADADQLRIRVTNSRGSSNQASVVFLRAAPAQVAQPSPPPKPSPTPSKTSTLSSNTAGTTPQTSKLASQPAPVTAPVTPVAPPVPQIASVTPSQLTTSTQIQTITINGSGFDSGSRVELMYGVGPGAGQWRAPLNGYQVPSNSQIRVSVLTGADADQLRIRVTNSRGSSNQASVVFAKAATAPAATPNVPPASSQTPAPRAPVAINTPAPQPAPVATPPVPAPSVPQIASVTPVQPYTPLNPSSRPAQTSTLPSYTPDTTPQTSTSASQPAPVTATPAPIALPVPQIASVTPTQLTTSTQLQTITINGSGFDSGSRVEWMYGVGPGAGEWRTPRYGYQVLSNAQIQVNVLTGADPDQLRIRVTNSRGSSNQASVVSAKAATAQAAQLSPVMAPSVPSSLPASNTAGTTPQMSAPAQLPRPVTSIDKVTAARIMPYAQASSDAYRDYRHQGFAPTGFTRDVDWTTTMRRAGVGQSVIAMYKDAGYSASIYRNDRIKEIVIAYRGTELPDRDMELILDASKRDAALKDFSTNFVADGRRFVRAPNKKLDPQYVAAVALAKRTQDQNSGYKLTLTGHSLGGGLASYAGSWLGLNVVTFNAARNRFSTRGDNPNQLNVVVPNDLVGDPNVTGLRAEAGVGALPGRLVTVPTSNPNDTHGIEGIIGGLSNVAR